MAKYDFETSVGFVVNSTAKGFQKALDAELRRRVRVTIYQWRVVVTLIQYPGLTQTEIAEKVGVEGSTLVPVIDKMENEGLLKRKQDSKDRRVNRIYLTPKADSLWNSMLQCAMQIRKVSAKGIPDEDLDTTIRTLKRISKNLADYLEPETVASVEKTG